MSTAQLIPAASIPAASLGWMGSLRDLPREHGFEPLRVEGTLPAELSGTLYRAGPSLFSSFGKPYGHLFDGTAQLPPSDSRAGKLSEPRSSCRAKAC